MVQKLVCVTRWRVSTNFKEIDMKYVMFAVVGAVMASGGIYEDNWRLYAVLFAVAIASHKF